jgi:uncharacterized protein
MRFFIIFLLLIACNASNAQTLTLNGHRFTIEIAQTQEQQAQGLMFRKTLAANAGMLFMHPDMQMRSMWMKNTHIPLDMLFFNEQRQLIGWAENTTPFSEAIITSPAPAQYVLEVPAGTRQRLGLKVGDVFILKKY